MFKRLFISPLLKLVLRAGVPAPDFPTVLARVHVTRRILAGSLVLLALCVVAWPNASRAAPRSCEAVSVDIAAARSAGDLDRLASLWVEARSNDTACEERALYCLGQSIALGHLEVAYAKGDAAASPEEPDPIAR